jgi:hypothetical protein
MRLSGGGETLSLAWVAKFTFNPVFFSLSSIPLKRQGNSCLVGMTLKRLLA